MPGPATDVLICGAGPTGLVLALRLVRAGVRVRIVDAVAQPGTTSRAIVVHARTLEFYRQMGLAEPFLEGALLFAAANLWVRGRRVAHVELGDIGKGLSPYPFLLVYPQDHHERFLIEHLRRAGVEVDRPTTLVGFEQRGDGVRVRLARADGTEETCEAAYLVGCDGSRSKVRDLLGIGFPGNTYSRVFYVADVDASGPVMNDELHVALDEADFIGIFPLRGRQTGRLIGTVEHEGHLESLTWHQVGKDAADRMAIVVERVNWFSTYRVHHRVVPRFRDGRVFLAGDAAHVHSPVGAQGMNTGIGDAVNLAWKLADVVNQRADARLLDSYDPERSAFARRLVATTDRAFTIATSPGRIARFVRTRIVPRVLPHLVRRESLRRFMFRTLSQIAIEYRSGPLSAGSVGDLHGGDRLPWIAFDGTDNHAGLDGLGWQAHVYGSPAADLEPACARHGIELRVFPWNPAIAGAALTQNALYLVRPDGYLALVHAEARARTLEQARLLPQRPAQASHGQSARSRSNV